MKVTLALLACLAVTGGLLAASVATESVGKDFLEKQKFLLEIVYRMDDPLMFEEWIKIGDELIVDKAMYEEFDKYMQSFYNAYQAHEYLPRGHYFGPLGSKYHFYQGRGLYSFFYYAKDWTTLVHNIAWARMHVSEGLFVFALQLAVFHRPDMKEFFLPSIYEIFPEFFFSSKYVYNAEKFDYDVWSREYTLYKELHGAHHTNYSGPVMSNYYPARDTKTWQWYKYFGLGDDFYLEEKHLCRDNIEEFYKNPSFKSLLSDVKSFYTPVDYTRDIHFFNEETYLSYFTEDIGWNSYWYYLNMYYSPVLSSTEFKWNRRGEWWIYIVQQMLARYNAERLAQGYPKLSQLAYYGKVETGYDPQLVDYSGNGFTFRKNYYEFESSENFELYNNIVNLERRIFDIIETGYYVTKDGKKIDFSKPHAIEYIGNILQGNVDVFDAKFLGYWYFLGNAFMSGEDIYGQVPKQILLPNVFHNFETVLRDPLEYLFLNGALEVYYKYYTTTFKPYTHEELLMPGVEIINADISKLTTYFDYYDADITNLYNGKMTFADGSFVWDKSLFARQARLNHKPFDFTLKVQSKQSQKVIVHSFYAPAVDEFGEKIEVIYHPDMFILLDHFIYDLVEGENVIKRSSDEFYFTVHDQTTYSELYKYVMHAYEHKEEFTPSVMQSYFGFPDRLILPHGWEHGFPVKFFFMLTPYTGDSVEHYHLPHGLEAANDYYKNLPFGYPFNRKIDSFYEFIVPNMYFKDAPIYYTGYEGVSSNFVY